MMKPYVIASYLWTKTRSLRLQDLDVLKLYPNMSLQAWEKNLKNNNLKKYLQQNQSWEQIARQELQALVDKQYSFSWWGATDYITCFKDLEYPPLFYTYKGDLTLLENKRISIVGSRRPSQQSVDWLHSDLYYFFKEVKPLVVSGAAIGIDQLAHAVAVKAGCPILAVLPCGLEQVYPKNYAHVISTNTTRGLFISEYSLFDKMHKYYFHQRNRLIAALSPQLFVVEARRRSGSLISARCAMDLGREVFVLPSCPTATSRLGSLDLMFDGAYAIRDYEDLIFATS